MRVLIACEHSGVVRDAFLARGHDAVSCDLLPTERPGPHLQCDVREVLGGQWDLMIAHPPCTYLSVSGMHWTRRGLRDPRLTIDALAFVRMLMTAPIPRMAIENPVSVISTEIRPPDQVIQPWQFGHAESKATCLWLRGLPLLQPTRVVAPDLACRCGHRFSYMLGKYGCPNCAGKSGPAKPVYGNQTRSGQNRLTPSEDRWAVRSATYQGIAEAMADQWGKPVYDQCDLFDSPRVALADEIEGVR